MNNNSLLFIFLLINLISIIKSFAITKPHHLEGAYQFTVARKTKKKKKLISKKKFFFFSVFGAPYLSSNCYPTSIEIAKPEFGCNEIQNNVKDKIVLTKRGVKI